MGRRTAGEVSGWASAPKDTHSSLAAREARQAEASLPMSLHKSYARGENDGPKSVQRFFAPTTPDGRTHG